MNGLITNFINTFGLPTIIIALMYFYITKPNKKKAVEQSKLLSSLSVGDEVLTKEGIRGRIKKIDKETCVLVSGRKVHIELSLPKSKIVDVIS